MEPDARARSAHRQAYLSHAHAWHHPGYVTGCELGVDEHVQTILVEIPHPFELELDAAEKLSVTPESECFRHSRAGPVTADEEFEPDGLHSITDSDDRAPPSTGAGLPVEEAYDVIQDDQTLFAVLQWRIVGSDGAGEIQPLKCERR